MATFHDIINSGKPVQVDFFATWCGPCQMMTPVLEELASEIGDGAQILKVDVDKNPAAAQMYQIQGVPTFILFKDGQVKWRQSGAVPKHMLEQVVKQHLG